MGGSLPRSGRETRLPRGESVTLGRPDDDRLCLRGLLLPTRSQLSGGLCAGRCQGLPATSNAALWCCGCVLSCGCLAPALPCVGLQMRGRYVATAPHQASGAGRQSTTRECSLTDTGCRPPTPETTALLSCSCDPASAPSCPRLHYDAYPPQGSGPRTKVPANPGLRSGQHCEGKC